MVSWKCVDEIMTAVICVWRNILGNRQTMFLRIFCKGDTLSIYHFRRVMMFIFVFFGNNNVNTVIFQGFSHLGHAWNLRTTAGPCRWTGRGLGWCRLWGRWRTGWCNRRWCWRRRRGRGTAGFWCFFWGYFLGEGFSGQCLLVVAIDALQPRYHVFVPLTWAGGLNPCRNHSCKKFFIFRKHVSNASKIGTLIFSLLTSRSWKKMRFKKMKTIRLKLKCLKNLSKKMLPKEQRWMMMTNWARIVSSFCHQQRLRSRIKIIWRMPRERSHT